MNGARQKWHRLNLLIQGRHVAMFLVLPLPLAPQHKGRIQFLASLLLKHTEHSRRLASARFLRLDAAWKLRIVLHVADRDILLAAVGSCAWINRCMMP